LFARKLRAMGKRLGTLLKSWNEVVGSFDHTLLPASRRFAELGVVPADQEIERPGTLVFTPREIQGRSLPRPEAEPRFDADGELNHLKRNGGDDQTTAINDKDASAA
jgi:hypothetical protein